MPRGDLMSFATRYAAAWSGKDPVAFAAFYDENGYERWTIGTNGLITKSDGHFDNDEYQRQLHGGTPPSPRP